jgi:hypothetical protein
MDKLMCWWRLGGGGVNGKIYMNCINFTCAQRSALKTAVTVLCIRILMRHSVMAERD